MQTNINKSLENKTNYADKEIDEVLLQNKDIFNNLILENLTRREKAFITVKEIDLIRDFEKNIIRLIEMCPPIKAKEILMDIGVSLDSQRNTK